MGQPGARPLSPPARSHYAGGGGRCLGVWRGDSRVKLFIFERDELASSSVGAGGVAEVIYTLSLTDQGWAAD